MDSKQDSVTPRVISIDAPDDERIILARIIKDLETFSAQSWAFASHAEKFEIALAKCLTSLSYDLDGIREDLSQYRLAIAARANQEGSTNG